MKTKPKRALYIVGYMGVKERHYWTPEEAKEEIPRYEEMGMTVRKVED